MTGSEHTSGPWLATGMTVLSPDDRKTRFAIADVRGRTKVQQEANARLIAASPELLEALKLLLADIEDYQRINLLGGEQNHCQVLARAAIAKAEGAQ